MGKKKSTFKTLLYKLLGHTYWPIGSTVKFGDKEWFDKEQISVTEGDISSDQFANWLHMDKEHLELRNNFKVTKKFLISKFDCIIILINYHFIIN